MALMSDQEQTAFARYLRQRLPLPAGHKELPLYALTTYSAQVLGLPRLLHWRGLTREQAQLVMQACKQLPLVKGRV